MAKNSAAKIAANNRYTVKTYEQIKVLSKRKARRAELCKLAANRRGLSYQAYIVAAIDDALQRDGLRLDDLPPITATDDDTTSSDTSSTQATT